MYHVLFDKTTFLFTFMFSVVQCEFPNRTAVVKFGQIQLMYSSVLTYECMKGKQMADGSRWKNIKCGSDGKWSEDIMPCYGRSRKGYLT